MVTAAEPERPVIVVGPVAVSVTVLAVKVPPLSLVTVFNKVSDGSGSDTTISKPSPVPLLLTPAHVIAKVRLVMPVPVKSTEPQAALELFAAHSVVAIVGTVSCCHVVPLNWKVALALANNEGVTVALVETLPVRSQTVVAT